LIPKNTFSSCGDLDEESDGSPPSPKKTDATEMKTDKSLQNFIEALPHLETLHYGFKLQGSNQNKIDIAFVLLQKASLLGEEEMRLLMIISHVGRHIFKVKVLFNIGRGKAMNIIQLLPFILEH